MSSACIANEETFHDKQEQQNLRRLSHGLFLPSLSGQSDEGLPRVGADKNAGPPLPPDPCWGRGYCRPPGILSPSSPMLQRPILDKSGWEVWDYFLWLTPSPPHHPQDGRCTWSVAGWEHWGPDGSHASSLRRMSFHTRRSKSRRPEAMTPPSTTLPEQGCYCKRSRLLGDYSRDFAPGVGGMEKEAQRTEILELSPN